MVEISSKRVKFLGIFASSHINVITATWHTSKVFKASQNNLLPHSSMITHLVRIIRTFQKTINKLLVRIDCVQGVAGTFQNWQSAAVMKKWERNKQHSLSSINNIFNHKGKGRFKFTFPFYLM